MASPAGVAFAVGAAPTPDEVNAAYAWVEWPEREPWRIEAVGRSSTWITARDADGALIGMARVLDDGGLHASLWDVIVDPTRRRAGIGTGLVDRALQLCRDRSLLVLVSTPAALGFFERLGFLAESHGHRAMYLRPQHAGHGRLEGESHF